MFRILGWIVLAIEVAAMLMNIVTEEDKWDRLLAFVVNGFIGGWIAWALLR